ncbi:helix-turn-helix domain-containing protein [Flavobacterium sp. UBA6135]|uniref:helix-turn-helix domain-containing protein n=1 Tax=Flavobacterium sp. UBA6135 TaxID=1946553 RepID=UPI0025C3CE4F|nr:helix-turn-helix transcriptional regulator [Flavobacterium sp. UBA6135]
MLQKILVKIRKIRNENSLSQEFMANELEISQSQYGKIENGKVTLSFERLQKIATILKVDITTLTNE